MGNRDRISELYYGEIYTEELQRLARERIHWTCKQVNGKKVLDIGCSQGITSILLGRENFKVTGIDIEKHQIEYAEKELEKENTEVQQNISFKHGNFSDLDLNGEKFDSIILGEIIEHLHHPDKLYKDVWNILNENGQVIISTPFGVNNHFDHKTTYYISNLYREINKYITISNIVIIGKWLCVSGTKKSSIDNSYLENIPLENVVISDKAFHDLEREYIAQKNQLEVKNKDLKAKKESIQEQKDLLNNQLIEIKQKLEYAKKLEEYKVATLNKEVDQNKVDLNKLTQVQIEKEKVKNKLTQESAEKIQIEKELNKEIEKLKRETEHAFKVMSDIKAKVDKQISNRDKNVNYLRKKVTVLEQSTSYKVTNLMTQGLKNPLKLPKSVYMSTRTILGGIKRKLKRQKKKYKLVKLPFDTIDLNIDDNMQKDFSSTLVGMKVELNELLMTGLFDTPESIETLRVAAILDDFSKETFKHDCELITFGPDNWREVLSIKQPHILLVESAWKGNGGSWQYRIGKYNIKVGPELDELLAWCKTNKIPTVFWNKEDPIHTEKFIDTAIKFDHIYTTDLNCVERYKEEAGHNRVGALTFAASPVLHNPTIISGYQEKDICFAGSYYGNRHEERRLDQLELLDAAKNYDLEIFDRNYVEGKTLNTDFDFPERFETNIKGSRPYNKLVHDYKRYKVFLNVNSVQNSPTMFSRRVFELLACGTSVVSTYSEGISEIFGELVPMVSKGEASKPVIDDIMNNTDLRDINKVKGIRAVYTKHTYRHKLYQIAIEAGFENLEKPYNYNIKMIAFVNSGEEFEKVKSFMDSQSYKNIHIWVVTDNSSLVDESNHDMITVQVYQNINEIEITTLLDLSENDLFGKLNVVHKYGENYLLDMKNAFIYSDADIVGKANYFWMDGDTIKITDNNEYSYTTDLNTDTVLIRGNTILNSHVDEKQWMKLENTDFEMIIQSGLRVYTSDRFNFIYNPNGEQIDDISTQIYI
ncbi:methyltransferase domain-containing protein [Salipaludibacillus sp. CF4.18]|uniref:methyltransferase domain-containing protein n=1 Tax=Salipaludibacillus sp. CF4.18 TaxID=3373081 RepID=UPI003EE4913B